MKYWHKNASVFPTGQQPQQWNLDFSCLFAKRKKKYISNFWTGNGFSVPVSGTNFFLTPTKEPLSLSVTETVTKKKKKKVV